MAGGDKTIHLQTIRPRKKLKKRNLTLKPWANSPVTIIVIFVYTECFSSQQEQTQIRFLISNLVLHDDLILYILILFSVAKF